MQKLNNVAIERANHFVEDSARKLVVSGSLIQIGIAHDDQGNFLKYSDLITWMSELIWKAKMFDEMNQGFSAVNKKTGEKVGPFATQYELGIAIKKSAVIVSRYYSGYLNSREYTFIREPYYTFSKDFVSTLFEPKAKEYE